MMTSVEDKTMMYDPEIEKLLPWYAKGLLDAQDTALVEDYLADHSEMKLQLDLIEEESLAIEQQHAALGAPSVGGLDRLLADIETEEVAKAPVSAQVKQVGTGFAASLKRLLDSFKSPSVQFAAMAAALIIVAQGVVIGSLMPTEPVAPKSGTSYVTASGPQQVTEGAKFLISFRKEARMGDIAVLLKQHSASLVAGPKVGGFYEILITKDKLPEQGVDGILKIFEAEKDLVQFVSVSK